MDNVVTAIDIILDAAKAQVSKITASTSKETLSHSQIVVLIQSLLDQYKNAVEMEDKALIDEHLKNLSRFILIVYSENKK